jgi:hypothetical protein
MAHYQIYFDTTPEQVRVAGIGDGEIFGVVLGDLLSQLKEEGFVLKGKGDPVAVHNGRVLDLGQALPPQNVKPNEVLRVQLMEIDGNG